MSNKSAISALCADIQNLSFSFRNKSKSLEVLNDITFSVNAGEVVSIVGPSGCGKSTLLRCIAGLLSPEKGVVLIDGRPPFEAQKKQDIGFVFQDTALLPWRTVQDNILLSTEVGHGKRSSANGSASFSKILSLVQLEGFKNYYPHMLSGGMKQRVALARTLLTEPKLLLLDEPFGALDLITRTRLSEELHQIINRTNLSAILVTHSIEEAVFLGSKVIVLSNRPARILDRVTVDLPAARTTDIFEDERFVKACARCRSLLHKST